ncbi:hypothetical protein GCM10027176_03660 [Actinoallomurus bryophytorum]|uniref:Putative membrane protein YccC n=1 Tax=Actinoallomurus bryophytorum TaxID=1490222 RepID=A0A543CJS5_9ACTN|nr:FUSC family protein [Actinoallomurus bryophytorum]TQL97361.1 putative membrane protein YccC [Actinoallomurus bryophytorum]
MASEGRAAPFYGLATAVGVTTPLVIGVFTGHAADSVPAGLGAFYVAFAGPKGPYGARARAMLATVAVVTVFTWFGGLLNGHPWLATVIVPVVAAVGAALSWMGPTAALCTLIAAVRPPTSPVFLNGILEMAGGLWVSVLLLAPWVTDRLRPLRTSVVAAARAVAGAVDALPDSDPDLWDRRRREAYDAIRQARATYAFYRGLGHEDPRRLADVLDRAVDETVVARSLLGALRQEAPPPEWWERELRAVGSALARRCRELAEALETGGSTPGESVALHRFVRVSDDVRRMRVHDRDDVVGSAMVLQVRRMIERIAATIEEAAGIVSGGLRAGFDTTLPERRDGGRRRLTAAVMTGSPGFRHAARVGTAIALAMALDNGLRLPYGYWLPITVTFCLRDSYGGTVERVVKRVGGATVGGTVAALALAVAPEQATLIILVFVGAALGFALSPVNHAYWVMFATPLVMLLIDFTQQLSWRAATWRIGLTVAAGAMALAAARTLWPAGTRRLLPERLARLFHTHAELARTVAARFEGRPCAPVHQRLAEASSAAMEVEDSMLRLAQEPAPPGELLRRLRDTTAIARRLRDYLGTLGALAEEEPVDAGPVPAILERVADHLDAHGDDALELDDLLRELDDHLSSLCRRRRAEIAGGAGVDAVSSMRKALAEVAGARHALRALASDAERLTEVAP